MKRLLLCSLFCSCADISLRAFLGICHTTIAAFSAARTRDAEGTSSQRNPKKNVPKKRFGPSFSFQLRRRFSSSIDVVDTINFLFRIQVLAQLGQIPAQMVDTVTPAPEEFFSIKDMIFFQIKTL